MVELTTVLDGVPNRSVPSNHTCKTAPEFSDVRFHGDTERAKTVYAGCTPLTGDDIADIILFVVNAPEHVDIFNVVVMPTAQRHSMIVHREDA